MEFFYERYQRQTILPEIGMEGQQKLLQSKVLVVGAGGLGCPVLQYLAAAGIGTIGIVDDDEVALSNLHRQVLYSMADVGLSKAVCAATKLRAANPDIRVQEYNERLTNQNALDLINAYDIIVDGTDAFASRYMINDACVLLGKTLVYGAISKFEGQVSVFNVADEKGLRTANYRDVFPLPPAAGTVLNCAEAGVLGVLPGIIGTIQATEIIKLVTGIGQPLTNRLLTYNTLNNQLFEIAITPSEATMDLIPSDATAFRQKDYDLNCAVQNVMEITYDAFQSLLQDPLVTVIDVREKGELPFITDFSHLHLSLTQLHQEVPSIDGATIVVLCQSGQRSRQAAGILFQKYGASKKIYSLKGGIRSWRKGFQSLES